MTVPVATYSIAACDLEAAQWGVATQSKFLAVGSVVPWAEPHVGAIATQAHANPRYGPAGLRLLREGRSAAEAAEELRRQREEEEARRLALPKSYKVGVKTSGDKDWCCNGLRFKTEEEASTYGSDLACRWMAVWAWQVLPSDDEPNR